jgi:hypothetical protein
MATDAVTPNVSSAPPAAAPAAPAPAAAAPVAAPPAAAPVAAPATPAANEPIRPNEGEGNAEFLQRVMKAGSEKKAAAEAAAAEVPVVEPPKAEAAVPAAGDTPAVEGVEAKPAVEAKPDAAAVVEPPKPEGEAEEEFTLDPLGPLPIPELAAKFKEHPELAAALEKAGIERNTLFATARLATKAAKYDEIFDGDLDTATTAKQQAERFADLGDRFTAIKDPETTRSFLQDLMSLSYQLDDDGNPVIDPATKQPKTDGSVGRFMDNVLGMALAYQENAGREKKDEDLLAAVDILKARTGLSRGTASAEQENMTEEQKAREAAINSREQEIRRQEFEATSAREKEFEIKVASGIDTKLNDEIAKILSFTDLTGDLTKGQQKLVADEIREKVTERLKGSKIFFSKLDALMRRPMGDKTQQARVAHGINSARPLIPVIARQVLKEQGITLKAKASAKIAKSDAQAVATRSEIKTGGQPAKPAAAPNAQQLTEQVRTEFLAANKREPTTAEMFQAIAQKKAQLG